jgi:hypothetical protein
MISVKTDTFSFELQQAAQLFALQPSATPSVVANLNQFPLASRTAVRALAAAITSGVAST